MQEIIINGPCHLSGKVNVQGAKNSSMKHIQMALLCSGKSILHNIPDIGSNRKLLELVMLQGAEAKWEENTVTIDSTWVTTPQIIPAELFYYTSGAIFLISILAYRFGSCIVETDDDREDTGGCQIGSREFTMITDTLRTLGLNHTRESNYYKFYVETLTPFDYSVPVRSFSASVNAVLAALFKNGTSTIRNITGEADFDDTLRFLTSMGASISRQDDTVIIEGGKELHCTEFTNMYDRHDFITFLSAALATNSEIEIIHVDYDKMKLDCLTPVLEQMHAKLEFKNDSCYVPAQRTTLKPVNIIAGLYPKFITEWQVLFAPLLTQINGVSTEVETVFSNRMQHWKELRKMHARFEYYSDISYPEINHNPRAVQVFGPETLSGAYVTAADVRAGAALLLAGLIAQGETIITNTEQIHRGYERVVERLQSLGANIRYSD